MEYLGLISFLVVFWSLQVYLAYQQNKTIIKEIQDIQRTHHSGHLGVGQRRSKFNFGSGVILMIVTNNDGLIVAAHLLKGVSVFKRFETMESILNFSVALAYQKIEDKKIKEAFKEAINNINLERTNNQLSELSLV